MSWSIRTLPLALLPALPVCGQFLVSFHPLQFSKQVHICLSVVALSVIIIYYKHAISLLQKQTFK